MEGMGREKGEGMGGREGMGNREEEGRNGRERRRGKGGRERRREEREEEREGERKGEMGERGERVNGIIGNSGCQIFLFHLMPQNMPCSQPYDCIIYYLYVCQVSMTGCYGTGLFGTIYGNRVTCLDQIKPRTSALSYQCTLWPLSHDH